MLSDGFLRTLPFLRHIVAMFHHSAVEKGMMEEFLEKSCPDAAGPDFTPEDDLILLVAEILMVVDKDEMAQSVEFKQNGIRIVLTEHSAFDYAGMGRREIDIARAEIPAQFWGVPPCHIELVEVVGRMKHLAVEPGELPSIVQPSKTFSLFIVGRECKGKGQTIVIVHTAKNIGIVSTMPCFLQDVGKPSPEESVRKGAFQITLCEEFQFAGLPTVDFVQ